MRGRLVQMPLADTTQVPRQPSSALLFLIDPYYTFRLPCQCAQCLSILASRLCSPKVPELFHVCTSTWTLYLDFPSPCPHPGSQVKVRCLATWEHLPACPPHLVVTLAKVNVRYVVLKAQNPRRERGNVANISAIRLPIETRRARPRLGFHLSVKSRARVCLSAGRWN